MLSWATFYVVKKVSERATCGWQIMHMRSTHLCHTTVFFINVHQTAAGAHKVSMSCCFLHLSFSNFFHILFSLECWDFFYRQQNGRSQGMCNYRTIGKKDVDSQTDIHNDSSIAIFFQNVGWEITIAPTKRSLTVLGPRTWRTRSTKCHLQYHAISVVLCSSDVLAVLDKRNWNFMKL